MAAIKHLRKGILLFFFSPVFHIFGQGVAINPTGADPDNSAMLDVQSFNRGLLVPRMSKFQRLSIPLPANSLLVYQLDDTIGFWFYDKTAWVPVFRFLNAGTGLSGGTIYSYGTISIANSGVKPGVYGARDSIPQFLVNAQGQLVFAGNISISEKDSIIGNEVTDTLNALGMLQRFGNGTDVSPLKIGVNPGLRLNDVWMWDGNNWISGVLPPEKDSIIGNEITDVAQGRGILSRTGTGTSLDPLRLVIAGGANIGDVWTWNGSQWMASALPPIPPPPPEKDSVIGNEITDVSQGRGILFRTGAGTAASPFTLQITAGTNIGNVLMWDGTQWVPSTILIPLEKDSVIGNEVTDTMNALGFMTRFGNGTVASPYKIGVNPGQNQNDVLTWNGNNWVSVPMLIEKDSVIGNEVTDTLNSRGVLVKYGNGTTGNPYKIGVQPGLNQGDVMTWNGTQWISSIVKKEKDSVIGNEMADTLNAFGFLNRYGGGTDVSPYKVGVLPGINPGDVLTWDGVKWVSSIVSKEKDSVIGNEVKDTMNALGILVKYGNGTDANPYKIGVQPGINYGDVMTWNGSIWVSGALPLEKDSIVGNEVTDTIANGFLQKTGSGIYADPYKIGLKNGKLPGHVLRWNGTQWISDSLKGNTLDMSYDEGGPGNGRIIIADAGAVEINGTDGLISTGNFGLGQSIGSPGAGTRMFWNPAKASFRAGFVDGSHWNVGNVGNYSTAFGRNNTASGLHSFVAGNNSRASGINSFVIGDSSEALGGSSFSFGEKNTSSSLNTMSIGSANISSGQYAMSIGSENLTTGVHSIAIGHQNMSRNLYSIAIGYLDSAGADYSTAIGYRCKTSGLQGAIAMGYITSATNPYAVAIGYNVHATADQSYAIGSFVETNNKNGSMVFGDASTTTPTTSLNQNQMTMRFNSGYRLFSNSTLTTGVYMNGGVSGWTNYSDVNMKENFEELNGEEILQKIKDLSVTRWNYKNTDESIEYIGPMAQDFYKAFRLGGTDSLGINSIAIDGVNMAAIKALIVRTDELKEAQEKLLKTQTTIEEQQKQLNDIQAELEALKKQVHEIQPNKSGLKRFHRKGN